MKETIINKLNLIKQRMAVNIKEIIAFFAVVIVSFYVVLRVIEPFVIQSTYVIAYLIAVAITLIIFKASGWL